MRSDIDTEVARLAETQYGAFSSPQFRNHDRDRFVEKRRLRAGRWIELHPNVFAVAGSPDSYERRSMAAVLVDGRAWISHRGSARLHGMPGFDDAPVEITTYHGARRRDPVPGVIRHYSTLLPAYHAKTLRGLPTTTVARTLFDLCAVVHPGRAARAVDNCLSRKWVTTPALWRVLDDLAVQGRNGTCAMREILLDRGEGYVAPASDLERVFLDLLRRRGLPIPAREVDLGDSDQWIGRVEFVYRNELVLVEIDSRVHHEALLDFEHDRARDNRFAAQGWRILRITYDMISKQPADVERLLRRALRTTG